MLKRAKKVTLIIGTMLLVGIAAGVIMIKLGIYLPCPFRTITGYLCPGCGATRMSMALMRFDFVKAFNYNSMLFISLPLIMFLILSMCYRYIKFGDMKLGKKTEIMTMFLIAAFLIFGVIRNII